MIDERVKRKGAEWMQRRRTATGELFALSVACTIFLPACSVLNPFVVTQDPPPASSPAGRAELVASAPSAGRTEGVPPSPPEKRILVLTANDSASYAQVADALESQLAERFELDRRGVDDAGVASVREAPAGTWSAAVAIGAGAAAMAETELDVPTVFCQIFEYGPLLAGREMLFGVDALAPLELQLRSWKRIAPDVDTVVALMSPDQAELAARAEQAATANELDLTIEFAQSDREALYRFRRIAGSVDGLWVLPNSEILSPRVLRELLAYAKSRGVHSIVFDETLLDWGGLLSVGTDAEDVAAAVAGVIGELVAGNATGVDRVTPLTTVDVRLNETLANALGIVPSSDPLPTRSQASTSGH